MNKDHFLNLLLKLHFTYIYGQIWEKLIALQYWDLQLLNMENYLFSYSLAYIGSILLFCVEIFLIFG